MDRILKLEESSKRHIPEYFQRLIESLPEKRTHLQSEDKRIVEIFSLENDYMLCILVTVAVECGFRLECSRTYKFDIRATQAIEFQENWRDFTQGHYSVDLLLAQLCTNRFLLLLVPVLRNSILVNLLTLKEEIVVESAVELLDPSQWLSTQEPSIPEKFINLSSLSQRMRDFFQVEADVALNSANVPNPSLLGMPEEIKRTIFILLKSKDLVRLTATCKAMHRYQKDKDLWKYFLKKDFNLDEPEDPYDNYIAKFCTDKVIAMVYADLEEEIFLSNRSTSVDNFYV